VEQLDNSKHLDITSNRCSYTGGKKLISKIQNRLIFQNILKLSCAEMVCCNTALETLLECATTHRKRSLYVDQMSLQLNAAGHEDDVCYFEHPVCLP
jgi:hypothetical protein